MQDHRIGKGAYRALLALLENQGHTENSGAPKDLNFLIEDGWLKDTAVVSNIVYRQGMWEVELIFALGHHPKQLIKRVITSYPTRQEAQLSAQYMRRLAAKDARGTIRINTKRFDLSIN